MLRDVRCLSNTVRSKPAEGKMKPLALLTFALLGTGMLVLFACQDTSEVTEPSTAVAASTAATTGSWGQPFTTPAVAVHVHLLPTGKVLLWGDQKGA